MKFKCEICGKEFEINDFFKMYQQVKNEENRTKNEIYCPSCGEVEK